MTLLLTNEEVEQALTPQDAIAATESIYRELAEGKALNRARSQVYLPAESRENPGFQYRMKTQEGGSLDCGVWALRVTSDMAGFSFTNGVKRRRILPVATGNKYCGLVILFDVEKIEPVAIMPDGVIQKVRVAAMSAVGARYLSPDKPRVLGLFGSGWQASAHLEFLAAQYNFDQIKVFSPNQDHCREFCRSMSEKLGREVRSVDNPKEAVDGSDFVQAATAAWDPVFDGHWIEKGMYVASIGGSDASNKRREIDDETIRRADVYFVHSKEVARNDQSPDVWEAAQKGIVRWEDIGELQDLVAGKLPGRTSADQITLFNNNTGAGTQFAAVGSAVVKRARAMGLGRELPTEWFLEKRVTLSTTVINGYVNEHRRKQLLDLMAERGWDSILLYGNAWRKDPFRSLVNFNFSGDHALARLSRSGEITVIFSDPWDAETASAKQEPEFVRAFAGGASAVAGLEFMEERFVAACGPLPVSATADVEELRRVKTAEEIGYIHQACDLADRGYQHFAAVVEPGMREFELVAEVEAFLKTNGAEDNFMLIASGGTEVVGMKPPTDRKLQKGDSVTTELTPQVNGYYAQICRTLVLGEPSPGQLQAFAIFSEAQQAAEDLIKPGITAADAARAQNDVFRKYGYGDYTGSKYTRVRGHCLGLYPDETPHILEDVDYVLKRDMVVIAHPNTYLPLSGYMVFGDTLLLTETGNVRLNKTEKKLFVA